jgi:folate-binding protein YgfZ
MGSPNVVGAGRRRPPYTVLMRHESPLRHRHADYQRSRPQRTPADAGRPGAARGHREGVPEVEFVPYEPAGGGEPACELVATYGDLESEYAAVRRGAAIFDAPHRGTIVITGADRREFLNRMVTQQVGNLEAGVVRETFWLNRKGRIEADLRLIELGDRMLAGVDVARAAPAVETLNGFVFSEDVTIADATDSMHHLEVHGPQALALVTGAGADVADLGALAARVVEIAGIETFVTRCDRVGEIGLDLIVPRGPAEHVWDALLAAAERMPDDGPRRARPVGWHAINVARIEAGTPLFGIDFGPENLPHETGLLHRRVSFTKGCYLGQEIVARIESQGRPKQRLVGLRPARDLLPVAGAPVYGRDETSPAGLGDPVGAVTSSTLAPMLGSVPVAFAMVRSDHAEPGTTVVVSAEGEHGEAAVCDLRFYQPAGAGT